MRSHGALRAPRPCLSTIMMSPESPPVNYLEYECWVTVWKKIFDATGLQSRIAILCSRFDIIPNFMGWIITSWGLSVSVASWSPCKTCMRVLRYRRKRSEGGSWGPSLGVFQDSWASSRDHYKREEQWEEREERACSAEYEPHTARTGEAATREHQPSDSLSLLD